MHRTAVVALLLLVVVAAAAAAQGSADAYLDERAAELVRAARERRNIVDRRIERYQVRAVERISIGLRAGIGERLLFRRETASRIDWTLDTVRIDILGAREVVPAFTGAPQVPSGLTQYMPSLAFDPVNSEMLLRLDSTTIRHPLAPESEQHYRFRTGDSTVITLPGGRQVRLRELQVLARRREPTLITGSFWVDVETHAVVQAYFRLARGYDADLDDGDAPPFLKPMRAELDYIAIDYGLWDLRWWLPRSVAAHGLFQAGPIRMPLSFERRYDDYTVFGDTTAAPAALVAADTVRPCRPRVSFSIQVGAGTPSDSAVEQREREALEARAEARRRRRAEAADSTAECDREFVVTRRSPSELLDAEELPSGGVYNTETLLDSESLRRIAARIRDIPSAPWELARPVLQWPLNGPGLLRYNRVEGLSLGGRAILDIGAVAADAEVHVATAIPELFAEVGLTRRGRLFESRAAAYRRLDAADFAARPLSFGSSVGAVLLGRDENDYFQASGAELHVRPPETRRQWYDLRLFAERQRAVGVNTDFSIPHLLDDTRTFRPNLAADAADQLGAALRLRYAHGLNPAAFRWAAELQLHGETGDYRLLRPALHVRASRPLLDRLTLSLDGAAGTMLGTAPAQRLWQIGGAATLRGYEAGILRGPAFWRARAEIGAGIPFARLAIFGDAAWAGARADFERSSPLHSAGVGITMLDGLLRFDVARALDPPRDWRVHVSVGGN